MDTRKAVGRPKLWADAMQAKFGAGTFARIAGMLRGGETRQGFVRSAVEAELERRERTPSP